MCLCALQQSDANIYALGHQTPVKGFHKENAISYGGGCSLVSKKSGKSLQSSSNINHTKTERERRRWAHMFSTTSRRRLVSDSDCHRRHKPCIPELWLVSFCSGPGDCPGTCVCVCIVNLRACPALWLYLSLCITVSPLMPISSSTPPVFLIIMRLSPCPLCQPPLPASPAPVSRPS